MGRKSVAEISREVNGKKVRTLEAKGGAVLATFADGTQLVFTSERPISVAYGPDSDEGEAEPVKASK